MSALAADTIPVAMITELDELLATAGDQILDPVRPWRVAERAADEWEQWGLGSDAYRAQEAAAAYGVEV